MAITVDTAAEGGGSPNITSYTITSLTVASGASALFCTPTAKDTVQGDTVPTCVWDAAGVNESLTLVGTELYDATSTHAASIHGLLAPTAKTATLTVTMGGTATWGYAGAVSIQGGSTSALSEATATNTGSGVDYEPDIDITSLTDGAILIAAHAHRTDNVGQTPSHTAIFTNDSHGGDNCAAQYNIKTTAGALNLNWTGTFGNENRWVAVAIAYAPAAAGGVAGPLINGEKVATLMNKGLLT